MAQNTNYGNFAQPAFMDPNAGQSVGVNQPSSLAKPIINNAMPDYMRSFNPEVRSPYMEQAPGQSTGVLQQGGTPPPPADSLAFFNNDSMAGNIGQGMGLAGGALSLANMLQTMAQGREAFKTNKSNIEQQMSQRKEAFNRNTARQDATRANIQSATEASLAKQNM